MPASAPPLAWAESPLQLIGAAEWASAHDRTVDVAGRLVAQVEETAAALTRRGARFGAQAGFWGIPWRMLAAHDHWLVGDGFSGQFRLAAAVLRPKRLTFLDDGLNAVAFADAVTGARAFRRPGVEERGLTRRLAPFALDAIRHRAAAGRADIFTAFPMGSARLGRLADLGAVVSEHDFAWLRRTRPSAETLRLLAPHRRIILGSAGVVDGRFPLAASAAWVRAQARGGAAYLPHRREDPAHVEEIARVSGVRVVRPGVPVELVLAGDPAPREIVTLRSSAAVTLRRILAGTESVVRETAFDDAGAREAAR
ncbi:hypothetical protein [Microbacterium sp. gxy059]|uniref:hypothetical protein n=1 Tax=Microbacterium sp. gxy059 TaxID=2957199 RepID=UPI003D96C516